MRALFYFLVCSYLKVGFALEGNCESEDCCISCCTQLAIALGSEEGETFDRRCQLRCSPDDTVVLDDCPSITSVQACNAGVTFSDADLLTVTAQALNVGVEAASYCCMAFDDGTLLSGEVAVDVNDEFEICGFTPTISPTKNPTESPTKSPTKNPTKSPTTSPTNNPTSSPVTSEPTDSPTGTPTQSPLSPTVSPTKNPTVAPTGFPSTIGPTAFPSVSPTSSPINTDAPTQAPDGGIVELITSVQVLGGVGGFLVLIVFIAGAFVVRRRRLKNALVEKIVGSAEEPEEFEMDKEEVLKEKAGLEA